ncbi:Chorismate mutase 2 [Platanthera zijinensis]|uniref:chorismate mutase n=1 Tax=Platanthera zijinensis TaxID=2320716 RepID=A0AAP0B4M1_9ASPA
MRMASLRTDSRELQLLLSLSLILCIICFISGCDSSESNNTIFTIDSLRDSLEKQEDFIVFCLIERARFPHNSPAYSSSSGGRRVMSSSSLAELFVRETEAIQAKFGRYQNPEELPFFPHDHTPIQAAAEAPPPFKFPQFLDPAASSVNVSRDIWNIYFGDLLQLITTDGDDGNYQQAAASDLVCLQALSKRIHYGRFVAEVKFRDSPSTYIPAIHAKDSETLTELVTSKAVEETVIERVKKKAEVFGQTVTVDTGGVSGVAMDVNATNTYKVDPSVASKLYAEWVIPLTKQVEVDYLLHRLD